MSAIDLLLQLQGLRVEIRVSGNELRLGSGAESLPRDLREAIEAQKPALVRLLREMSRTTAAPTARRIERAPRDQPLPLSFAQERLWFLSQLDQNSTAYNLIFPVRLSGPLDGDAIDWSLGQIVARHEVLRTTVGSDGDRAVQVIAEPKPFELARIDLATADDAEAEVMRAISQEERKPFDLTAGPLAHFALYRLGDDEHLLLLKLHHMLADRLSFDVLFGELTLLYEARTQNRTCSLPELAVQYADYAVWERRWYETEAAEALAYWKEQLSDLPTLDLPIDRPRPAMQTFRGRAHPFSMPRHVIERLDALGRDEGCTLFMTVLAAFNVLLSRHTGQEDIIVGTPVGGRGKAELEPLIGLFINMLPLRTDVSGTPTFRELLRRVRDVVLGGFEHQDMPFERLVAELQIPRDLSRNPVFVVMLNLVGDAPMPALGEVRVSVPAEDVQVAVLDLSLWLCRHQAGADGRFEYNRDLFDDETIAGMERRFGRLLEEIARDPDRVIGDIPILTEDERHRLLVEGASTSTAMPAPQCVHSRFEAQAAQTPNAVAIFTADQQISYMELNVRANRLSHHLQAFGVKPGVLVGLCLERSVEAVIAILAIVKAGGAWVPLDPAYPAERLALVLREARAPIVLTAKAWRRNLSASGALIVPLDAEAEKIAQRPASNPTPTATPDDLAYVMFTSGSTGAPKGVMVPHRAIHHHTVWALSQWPMAPDDRTVLSTSLTFDPALCEMWEPLSSGASLAVAPPETFRDLDALIAFLRSAQVTSLQTVPTMLRALLQSSSLADCPSLRRVFCGGDAMSTSLCRDFLSQSKADLFNQYGPTELTIDATWHHCTEPAAGETMPIGRPIGSTRAYVVDRSMRLVPQGVAGELCVTGPGVALGYLHDEELTAQRFVRDPFDEGSEAVMYRTGDRVRWRADGVLEFLGRVDEQVKIRGIRIEPGEVEAALCRHDAVVQAAVIARQDRSRQKQLVAYIVATGTPPSVSALRAFLGERLPLAMVPSTYVFLDGLPTKSSGKLDRRALPAPEAVRPELTSDYLGASNPIEETLADIWARLLGVDRVGVRDNFFDLGGDSILILQVVARAREAGLRFTPKQLFEHQTIADLAAVTDQGAAARAEQGPVTGPVPLTPIQHWLFERELPEPHHFNQPFLLSVRERLDPDRLQRAATHLLHHHDALRLRFARDDSGWRQHGAATDGPMPLDLVDLSELSDPERTTRLEEMATQAQRGLDLERGPLVRAVYFDLGKSEPGRFLLVAHHLVVDGVSWRILLEDLQTCYRQLGRGEPMQLPAKTTSFREWAQRLESLARSEELAADTESFSDDRAPPDSPLPIDRSGGRGAVASERTATVMLEPTETDQLLREVPAVYRTQINDVLLTALLQTFASWTGSRSLRVDLEGHGREPFFEDVDLSRTVGWFTTLFPVRLELPESDEPGDALKAVKERLRSLPRSGASYGLLRYLAGAPSLRSQPPAQVAFNYLGRFDEVLSDDALFGSAHESIGPSTSEQSERPYLLEINAAIGEGRLQVGWSYSSDRHDDETIRALASSFAEALRALIRHCRSPGAGGFTPSDFPLAQLDQSTIDRLAAEVGDLEDVYPLSQVQQGMLFHDLSAPGTGVYISQSGCVLRGLDPGVFRSAWQRAVDRHAMLRTAFVRQPLEEHMQVVRRRVELAWHEEDWSHWVESEQRARVDAFLAEQRVRAFAYDEAPLMRLALHRLDDTTHHFTWTFHLLLLDGWSTSRLLREVFGSYLALQEGRALDLTRPRPFSDYVAWMNRQDLADAEAFWREYLRGFESPTALGVAVPAGREPKREGRCEDRRIRMSPAVSAAVRDLAARHRLTLSTIAHGLWALVLSRYSGDTDVVFGSTVSGRPPELTGVESMLGVFINTLPVRVNVAADARVVPWLADLQTRLADLRQYEHTPLVDVQRWSQVPRNAPLFDSIIVFENYPIDETVLEHSGSLQVEDPHSFERTNYPLSVFVSAGDEIVVRIYHDANRFDGATVDAMLAHCRNLLEAMAAQSDATLAELPTLDEVEARELRTRAEGRRIDVPDSCFHQLFEARAASTPDAVAVVCGEESSTYAELNGRANQLAHHLRSLGAHPNTLIGISVERSTAMLVGLLGILKAGAAYVPLDPSYPNDRLAFIIEDAGLELLVTEDSVVAQLPPDLPALVRLDADAEVIGSQATDNPEPAANPGDLAYVIFTSGSTGKPKGVQIEHRALINFLTSMADEPGLTADDVLVAVTTISFDIAGLELYLPLMVGARVVIAAGGVEADGKLLAELLESCSATVLQATPATWRLLIESGWQGRPELRALCGGETLQRDLAEQLLPLCSELWNMYGPTETTIWSLTHRVESGTGEVSIGKPIGNTQLVLLDGHRQLVPIGVPGKLHLGGAGLARAYWNRPELTAEKFSVQTFVGDEPRRLYDTGDLARWLPNGDLEFLGRIDQQVKVRGFRIELGEIEAVLSQHEAVRACAVVVSEKGSGDKRLVGHVVLHPGQSATVTQLRASLSDKLPGYMVPSALVMLDELPLTPNGKIDRVKLSAIGGSPASADRYQPPTTDLEKLVAAIWREVLGQERIGLHDNFFELGGHSLLAMRVAFQVEEQLGIDVRPMELLLQTLSQFAAMCASRGAHVEPATPAPREAIARGKTSWLRRLASRLLPSPDHS